MFAPSNHHTPPVSAQDSPDINTTLRIEMFWTFSKNYQPLVVFRRDEQDFDAYAVVPCASSASHQNGTNSLETFFWCGIVAFGGFNVMAKV